MNSLCCKNTLNDRLVVNSLKSVWGLIQLTSAYLCSSCLMYWWIWYVVPLPLNHHTKSAGLSFLPVKTQTQHHHKHLNLFSRKEMWTVSFTQRRFKTTSSNKWHVNYIKKVPYFKPYNFTNVFYTIDKMKCLALSCPFWIISIQNEMTWCVHGVAFPLAQF